MLDRHRDGELVVACVFGVELDLEGVSFLGLDEEFVFAVLVLVFLDNLLFL